MYHLLRQLLFTLPPEAAHKFSLTCLNYLPKLFLPKPIYKPVRLFDLNFGNRLGLSAGVDNNGDYLSGLSKLGFGFIELGGVTPKAQSGNPRPRIFRLTKDFALINRMGFPNRGVEYLKNKIIQADYNGVLGVNLGKNKDTPLNRAVDDYIYCMRELYEHVSYLTINISSPNTPGLRELQQVDYLQALVQALIKEQDRLNHKYKKYVPMLFKLTVDLDDEDLKQSISCLHREHVDGYVFSNTTINHSLLLRPSKQSGGLSGKPLFDTSTEKLKIIRNISNKPIIGVGGIMSADDAKRKISEGADLLQLYTGLIYFGPKLVGDIVLEV